MRIGSDSGGAFPTRGSPRVSFREIVTVLKTLAVCSGDL